MTDFRPFTPVDAPALLDLFRDTIRQVNRRDYSAEQIRAWASEAIDPGEWAARFEDRFVIVAWDEGRPVGFIELEPDGHIDRMFVAAEWTGRKIGSVLLAVVVAEARTRELARLFVEASITARPFFERHGFVTLAEQTVLLRGVEFINYRMERHLTRRTGGPSPAGDNG